MGPLAAHLTGLLGPLPEAAREAASHAALRHLAAGEALLREGQRWQHLWWVAEGGLRLHYQDREGRSSNKNFFLDGAMVWPITPSLAGCAVDFWVEALRPSRVWAVSWPAWQEACASWPAWQALEHRTLVRLLEEKMQREQRLLQHTATERYLALQAERPDWAQQVPLKHLASYLGVTDVALSRIRRRLNPG